MNKIYTIGHSTRTADELVALLSAHEVDLLVDVRTIPRSHHNPQFNSDVLPATLGKAAIAYTHLRSLGGLRRPDPNSRNLGWRNASFRGYADYMQTREFGEAIEDLLALASTREVAIMCAEAVPWRCHRSLIADALLARGIETSEIVSTEQTTPHKLTSFARIEGTTVAYPPEGLAL
jgi:uncharacterized protein (DUF488 family)